MRITLLGAIFLIALPLAHSAAIGTPPLPASRPTLDDILSAATIDGLRISPDGQHVAFRVGKRDIEHNRTTVQWYEVALRGGRPIRLGAPQDPLWMPVFAMLDDPVAQWLPNGEALAVLAVSGSSIAVRAVGPGDHDIMLTNDNADVRTFEIANNGRTLRYTTGLPRAEITIRQRLQEENGIHLDQSVMTEGLRLTDNYRIGQRWTTVRHGDAPVPSEADAGPDRHHEVALPASLFAGAGKARFTSHASSSSFDFEHIEAQSSVLPPLTDGTIYRVRRLESPDPIFHYSSTQIEATLADGRNRVCSLAYCKGFYPALRQAMVDHSTGEIVILADQGHFGHPALYGWNAATNKGRLIWHGEGSLSTGAVNSSKLCPVSYGKLVCVFAGPSRPAELVSIDLASGRMDVLADPNANLAAKAYPRIQLLQWPGPSGGTVTGVYVAPYFVSGPVPLVVTSYGCSGYLQGGTAQVTPEFILASHGIASLCVNMVSSGLVGIIRHGKMEPAQIHKDVLASLQTIISDLVGKGWVDRDRIGISGQSFSSIAIAYAISHSDLFRAASIGTGITIDPIAYYLSAPTPDSWRKQTFSALGLPPPDRDPDHIWNDVSPALNAGRIKSALLIQPPENEYLFALQLYTSIADAGGTVDMFLYPKAGHMLADRPLQQRSRAARSIAWFRFWLGSETQSNGVSPSELSHWNTLAYERQVRGGLKPK